MVLERALIRIAVGQEPEFEHSLIAAREVIAKAAGFCSFRALRGIESPQDYLLLIEWDSLAAHTEGFRGSQLFDQWRALIGPYFDGTPQVEHYAPLRSAETAPEQSG
ncbi:MAG: antibiotic biosynthesis monooxygenase [Solirubrobacteraceae bacterium]|jgi:heme-degrading monooxygenase HmoA